MIYSKFIIHNGGSKPQYQISTEHFLSLSSLRGDSRWVLYFTIQDPEQTVFEETDSEKVQKAIHPYKIKL